MWTTIFNIAARLQAGPGACSPAGRHPWRHRPVRQRRSAVAVGFLKQASDLHASRQSLCKGLETISEAPAVKEGLTPFFQSRRAALSVAARPRSDEQGKPPTPQDCNHIRHRTWPGP
jgi:hypothetical protein